METSTLILKIIILGINFFFLVLFFFLAITFKEGQEDDKSLFIACALGFGVLMSSFFLALSGTPNFIVLGIGIVIPFLWWLAKAIAPDASTQHLQINKTK